MSASLLSDFVRSVKFFVCVTKRVKESEPYRETLCVDAPHSLCLRVCVSGSGVI